MCTHTYHLTLSAQHVCTKLVVQPNTSENSCKCMNMWKIIYNYAQHTGQRLEIVKTNEIYINAFLHCFIFNWYFVFDCNALQILSNLHFIIKSQCQVVTEQRTHCGFSPDTIWPCQEMITPASYDVQMNTLNTFTIKDLILLVTKNANCETHKLKKQYCFH